MEDVGVGSERLVVTVDSVVLFIMSKEIDKATLNHRLNQEMAGNEVYSPAS